uniref:Uncharacterized protein n=1 Tax=Oryzias latipes TaxID=8090 RepID=A0A3B3HZ35_ORYLA
ALLLLPLPPPPASSATRNVVALQCVKGAAWHVQRGGTESLPMRERWERRRKQSEKRRKGVNTRMLGSGADPLHANGPTHNSEANL